MISEETILEFQKALKEEYEKEVTFEDASNMLFDLVTYFDLLAKMNNEMPRGP
jgi:hypothetical protein